MKHLAPSFFDLETQFAKIYELNDLLSKLKHLVLFDDILMFTIIVLQTIYNLVIKQMELQIRDRLSFHNFHDPEFTKAEGERSMMGMD